MNETIEFTVERARKDCEFREYLTTVFPNWMSYTPGGLNYKFDMTETEMEAHIAVWERVTHDFVEQLTKFSIHLDGSRRPAHYDRYIPFRVMERMSRGASLRRVRNSWKEVMKAGGWDCSDAVWRHVNGNTKDHKDEWQRFRDAVYAYTQEK